MINENEKIEQRMQKMKRFYLKAGKMIDNIPDVIPQKVRDMLKDTVLGDKGLKQLMEGIDNQRAPRIFLIGRTGVGKSSLINALCGSYIAAVSDTESRTENAQVHQYKDGDRVLMEIFDTRGISESESLNSDISAEDMLIKEINDFSPDVAILMLSCKHRDGIDTDVEFLKKVAKSYADINCLRLPIVVVVNKCDEMNPSRHKIPSDYPESKINKINEVVRNYKGIIIKKGLKIDDIVAVSSLIDWQTADGLEVSVEEIDNLPAHDIENLSMAIDGRYQIAELINKLEEAIQDFDAQMGLRMAARLTEVVHRIARQLNKIFSGVAATVALTPVPISDIYILLIIQALLVSLIASLSGRDISLDTAKEFIFSMGGLAGAGFGFRLAAQQSAKLLNAFVPVSGSAISAGIATLGTNAIGAAAISYYIDGNTIEKAKKKFKESREKAKQLD